MKRFSALLKINSIQSKQHSLSPIRLTKVSLALYHVDEESLSFTFDRSIIGKNFFGGLLDKIKIK